MSLATPTERLPVTCITPGTHHQRLGELRDRERQRRWTVVLFSSAALLIASLLLLGIVDYHLETVTAVRLIGLGMIVAIVFATVTVFHSWMKFEANNALSTVEHNWPELGQRLRTSHDYQANAHSVTPANPDLVRALETETQQRVTNRELAPLGSPVPIIVLFGLCVAAFIGWAAALIAIPDWRIATARLMLIPVHYSHAQIALPKTLAFGDDLMVQLHVDGRPLQSATIRYRGAGDEDWSEVAMRPLDGTESPQELTAVVRDCRDDVEVQVTAGHFDSGIHRVSVRIPLLLESWVATVTPPSYTGLPTSTGAPDGLRIPAGSTLELTATYNRSPSELDVGVVPAEAATADTSIADNVARVLIKSAAQPMDLVVRGRTPDGMADDSSLHINVVPDQRPALKFVAPEETSEAISTAEVRVTLQSSDDYGLSGVGIHYRIDGGPEQTLWEKSPEETSTALAHTTVLPLEDLDIAYPQAITYYAYAIDNREPEPQRITSELRFIDIRPFSRDYEFSDQKCDCQGECLTLEKLIKEQRSILGRTFAVVQQAVTKRVVGQKLAEDERDLRAHTQSLTDALLEKVGPQPSLIVSLRAMSDAISELADGEIAGGQAHEEHALAELIAARENLRKILKQSDAKAKLCRNVDKQQLDKIRKPEQNQAQKKEQQLASIRKQIEELATKQQSFCQSAKACIQPGESSSSQPEVEVTAKRSELAKVQQDSATEARSIENELRSGAFGALAPNRMKEAAESISQSGELISHGKADAQSIALAEKTAEQLQQLSEHLARRQDPDFARKLAAAGRQAERLAAEQANLSEGLPPEGLKKSKPGEDNEKTQQQKQLAGEAEELADVVDQLLADAADQDWQLQRSITEQAAAASPRQAAEHMNSAVGLLAEGQPRLASANGRRASEILTRFAAGVKEVEQALEPVRLAELQKAEQRAASLRNELRRANTPAEQAMVDAEARRFATSIAPLARNDHELSQAIENLPRFDTASTVLDEGLREIDEVLQQRIQEAIVSGAMQQAVGAVPPQYTDMVEEYYRVLSDDAE